MSWFRGVRQVLAGVLAMVIGLFSMAVAAQQEERFDEAGAYSFEVPQGVTQITVEVWGGGGKGGNADGNNSAAGGGGAGGYARSLIGVQPGQIFDLDVGAGSDSEEAGGPSQFGNETVRATGGRSVVGVDNPIGAAGGEGFGDETEEGGQGGDGDTGGSNRTGGAGGSAPDGLETGGGSGGVAGQGGEDGEPGMRPGGGGGGAATGTGQTTPRAGGSGADGLVRVSWEVDDDLVEISGHVVELGAGREGVTVSVAGGGDAVTDADGAYSIFVSPNQDVELLPEDSDLIFCPASRTVRVADSDRPGIGFQAFPDQATPINAGSGGDAIFTDEGDAVHVFCSVGRADFTPPSDVDEVEVLVVGGGGGGGAPLHFTSAGGGGGGAGGVVYRDAFALSGAVEVIIGSGGDRGDTAGQPSKGGDGGNSSFGDLIGLGGGGGSGDNEAGNDGGSGGGSRGEPGSEGLQPGSESGGFGNRGGVHIDTGRDPDIDRAATGGGGASEAGEDLDGDRGEDGGAGGDGIDLELTGQSQFYAGGGGGGAADNRNNSAGDPGAGGIGGGGRGGRSGVPAEPGFPATGGGGGGGNNSVVGAEGGSGVVVVRYPVDESLVGLLVSWWFDEDWTEASNLIPDRSGNGRDGTANGAQFNEAGAEGARPGSPGTCGFARVDDESNVSVSTDEGINQADSFTASFWLRMDDNDVGANQPSILAVGDFVPATGFAERWEIYSNFPGSRDIVYFIQQDNGDTHGIAVSPDEADDPLRDQWVHVTALHDAEESTMRFYLNGDEVDELDYADAPSQLIDASGPVTVGGFDEGNVFSAIADIDELRYFARALDDSEIEALFLEERNCSPQLDRFEFDVPATASVCDVAPAPVTLKAVDSNGDLVTNYTGTADLTTSSGRGNWALDGAQGTLQPDPHTANDGAASYTFSEADDGSASLTLANESADRLTITATDADQGQSGTSGAIQFQENAFVISVIDDLGEDFVAGRDHAILVEAWRRDEDTDQCGLVTDYDGDIALKGWVERSGDDPGGEAPSLSDAAGSDAMPDAEPADNNTSLVFEQGAATAQWLTTDVGQHALNLRDDSSGIVVDEEDNPIPVTGAGEDWTVRPFGFDVSVTDNQGAEGAMGPAFIAAGRPFEVNLRAVAWQAADDGSEDGQPDGHDSANPENLADLSDNPTTSAFGNTEDLSVGVTSDLVAGPNDADDPDLQGATTINDFTDGEASAQVSYLEVGSISLLADLEGLYLGRAVTVIGRSGYVGRFHPELFTVNADEGSFQPQCNGFVYSGQAHGYDMEPQVLITPRRYVDAGTGDAVTNYRGDWQRLTANDVARVFPGEDGTNDLAVDVIPEVGVLDPEGDGRMTYIYGADEYTYVKDANARTDPFTSDLTLQVVAIDDGDAQLDPDQNPVEITPVGVEIRYGRLRLDNAFGPEILNLIVPMRAEYWEDDRFRLNLDEGGADCWQYNTEDEVVLDQSELSGGSTSVVPVEDTLVAGEPMSGSELELTAPGEGNTGQVGVEFIVPIWLQDDFNGDGNLQNPASTATFGVYRGHDRIIHWREVR